jgi:hypothetical protein
LSEKAAVFTWIAVIWTAGLKRQQSMPLVTTNAWR